jgi:hypothetical protein
MCHRQVFFSFYNSRMSGTDKPLIFISCRQYFPHEKSLGLQIKAMIEELTPFVGYFAEDQSSVNGLVANILERLYTCAGFIAVMHPRGRVTDELGATTVRASLWIEQEIAIVALIQQLVRKNREELPVAAYVHQSIKMEGIRTLLHLNPLTFEKDDVVITDLRQRLSKWVPSQSVALKSLRDQKFREKMGMLNPESLEALRILTLEGPTSDYNALRQLKMKGLAANYAGVFEGLANTSNLVQPVPGQHERIYGEHRIWAIKPRRKNSWRGTLPRTRRPRNHSSRRKWLSLVNRDCLPS